MKTKSSLRIVLPALAALACLGLTACQSASSSSASLNQGSDTTDSIQKAADLIDSTRQQVRMTTASLRNLVERPGDATAQYKVAVEQVNKLKADAEKIAASAAKMRAQGDQYLAAWAKQISAIHDADLQNTAFERRGEVAAKLQTISKSYQSVQTAFEPFRQNLADIQTVLGTDLSAGGIESVRPFVAKATANSQPVLQALDKLAQDFRDVGVSLQPATAPAAK